VIDDHAVRESSARINANAHKCRIQESGFGIQDSGRP
jgi:hypothetical protein